MEIGPILRAMVRNKTGPILIALQIALTLAVVVNAVFIIQKRIDKISRPTGMDIDNIITLISSGIHPDFDGQAAVRRDLEALQAIPGVIAATNSQHIPLSGSGWGTELKASAEPNAPRVNAAQYFVNADAIEALGLTLEAGRGFTEDDITYPEDFAQAPDSVILTRTYADALFPDGNALGAPAYDGLNRPRAVVGIIEHMHGAWVSWDELENVMLVPMVPPSTQHYYIVRTEPGERDRLMPVVERTLRRLDNQRIIRNVRTHSDIKARSYMADRGMAVLLAVVVSLIVLVTAVGIVGLASFAVRQRIKQIGTRRAMGARRGAIVRYFMVENWLITTGGVALGSVLTVVINYWLVTSYELERLNPVYVPMGIVALWLLGLASVAWPARKASDVSPAVATRTI